MAVDPGVAVDGGPASKDNVAPPNGPAFKLTTPLAPGQSIELPARIHVQAGSAPGRIRLGASANGRYGDGPLAVPAAGDIAIDGPLVTKPATPAGPGGPTIPVGGKKGTATAGASTGSGGRKPARTAAGVSGAAGSAASAAPVTPAPSLPAPPAVEAPPITEPATPAAPEPAPGPQAGTATTTGEEAAPKHLPQVRRAGDRRRWAWGGAAAIFLVAIAAAGVTRLLGGARR
jgi:hypothetical protein